MDLGKILDERWSCRQFLPDQVPKATIERLLQLSQRTPSWCNTQPWNLIVTEGSATDRFRKSLFEHVTAGGEIAPDFPFPAGYSGDHRQRRKECGLRLYDSVGIVKGDQAGTTRQMLRNFEFFDAPHVAIMTSDEELGTYGAIDCGLYIDTFLLGAHSLGLAATAQAAIASYSPFVRDYFDVPDNRRVVVGISFGFPDLEHPINSFRTSRADLDSVVTWHSD
jgi:nitroreductase